MMYSKFLKRHTYPIVGINQVNKLLTLLCRVNSPTSTFWTGPFPIKGVSVASFYHCHVL